MKFVWLLLAIIFSVVIGSLLACPSDLHGVSTCSPASRAGVALGFYLIAPGVWLGSFISPMLSNDVHAGASLVAYAIEILAWLMLVAFAVWRLSERLARRRPR